MSNTFTKGYINGSALTESQLDTAYQTLQLDVANTAVMTTGSSSGQALLSNGSGVAASFQTIPDPQGPFALRNYGLKATVATGVMTVSLTTKAGTAPSGSDKVDFNYSTNGTTSASYTTIQISSATTLTVNASATLGYSSTSTNRVYIYGYYNTSAATVKLAISARSGLDSGGSVLTVAVSASSDSAETLYATAALTVMPRLLGVIDAARNSGGSWQTPSKVNIVNESQTASWKSWVPASYLVSSGTPSITLSVARFQLNGTICNWQVRLSVKSPNTSNTFLGIQAPTAVPTSLTTAGAPCGAGAYEKPSSAAGRPAYCYLSKPASTDFLVAKFADAGAFTSSSGIYSLLVSGFYEIT